MCGTRKSAYGEVSIVSLVKGSHHILGVEHLLRKLRNGDCTELLHATSSEWSEANHEEM